MGCFNWNDNNSWWIIILVLIFAGDSCIFDNIRRYVCGDNMIWIILILLLCNGNCGSNNCGCEDNCNNTCTPSCGCC